MTRCRWNLDRITTGKYKIELYGNHRKIAKLLVNKYNIDESIKNKDGRTAKDMIEDDKFIFSSSINTIVKLLGYTPKINKVALSQYLQYFAPINENTFFQALCTISPSGCNCSHISLK